MMTSLMDPSNSTLVFAAKPICSVADTLVSRLSVWLSDFILLLSTYILVESSVRLMVLTLCHASLNPTGSLTASRPWAPFAVSP